MSDIWSYRDVLASVAGLQVASVSYDLTADYSKPLPKAFSLEITPRGLGIDLASSGSLKVAPLANGKLSIPLLQVLGAGPLQGEIQQFRGLDKNGNTIAVGDTKWSTAASVAFTISPTAIITIPITEVVALAPNLGWIAKAALAAFGPRLTLHLLHRPVVAVIRRDAKGKLIS